MPSWYYEFGGKKIGPVPSETLRHLADHSAIKPDTRIWRDDLEAPFVACKIKNLFPASSSDMNVVHTYLTTVLEAAMDDETERLDNHEPTLRFFHSSTISGLLVDYKILSIIPKTPPKFDPSLPVGQQTKPVRQMFDASVILTFCERPSIPTSIAKLRELKPGRHDEAVTIRCKEFTDGDWIFIDASLES